MRHLLNWGYNSKNNDDEPQFNDEDIAHDDNQLNESDLYETARRKSARVDLKAEEKSAMKTFVEATLQV